MPFESNELDLLIVVHMFALLRLNSHFLHVYLFSYTFLLLMQVSTDTNFSFLMQVSIDIKINIIWLRCPCFTFSCGHLK